MRITSEQLKFQFENAFKNQDLDFKKDEKTGWYPDAITLYLWIGYRKSAENNGLLKSFGDEGKETDYNIFRKCPKCFSYYVEENKCCHVCDYEKDLEKNKSRLEWTLEKKQEELKRMEFGFVEIKKEIEEKEKDLEVLFTWKETLKVIIENDIERQKNGEK